MKRRTKVIILTVVLLFIGFHLVTAWLIGKTIKTVTNPTNIGHYIKDIKKAAQ